MPQAIKVGIFVVVCLVVLGVLIFQVEDLRLFGEQGTRIEVLFDSVAGLNDKAPVRVAGVRVGRVEGIVLDGRRARVKLLLEQPVELGVGSSALISNAGILGDKYIELVPGPAGGAALAEGTVLEGETPVTFDQALGRFDSLGQSLQRLTGDVSAQGDMGMTIRRLLDNLEATSADIRLLVSGNRQQVNTTLENFARFSDTMASQLPELTSQVSRLLDDIDTLVSENRGDVKGSLENIRRVSQSLETTVDNLNAISGQIKSGQGTLGKLFYDDTAHDSLVATLDAVKSGVGTLNDTLGRVQKLQLDLGLEATLYPDAGLDNSGEGGSALRLRLANHPRRYYQFALVDTPQGKVSEEVRVITTTADDGTVETTTIREQKQESTFTLTAQLGYTVGDFELRAGLIESSGGAGIDWHLFDRRLILSLEAFDFSRPDNADPHLRLTTRYHLTPNVYLLGGYDDPLVDEYQSIFFGAGITWRDEDLKYLLGSVPLKF